MRMERKSNVSIIVPCYNEVENLEKLNCAIKDAMHGYGYKIIYVNDGSTDQSYDVLKEMYMKDKDHIKVVHFSRNFGKEAAIFAGLKYADGELVSIIDADLQQSPQLIRKMTDFLLAHQEYDVVAMYQDKRNEGRKQTFLKNSYYKIINKLCEIDFYNGASDFRTFRRPVADALLELPEYYRFSKGLFSWIGFETYYMPYIAEKRSAGVSKWSMRSLFKYGLSGMVSFSTFPLKLSLYIGFLVSIAAIGYMLFVIGQYFSSAIKISGYATVVCLVLLLGGVQLMMLGIIGEYLAKTYIQGKNRPVYIVKELLD